MKKLINLFKLEEKSEIKINHIPDDKSSYDGEDRLVWVNGYWRHAVWC